MGTDIYMHYDGDNPDDWETGYIRASIGMVNENWVLRQLFSPEVWENINPDCPECKGEGFKNYDKNKKYDEQEKCKPCNGQGSKDGVVGYRFHYTEEGFEKLYRLGTQYMYAEQAGEQIATPEEVGTQHGFDIMKMMSKLGFDKVKMQGGQSESAVERVQYALEWLQSVFEHYKLGLKLEKDNKNPRVNISW